MQLPGAPNTPCKKTNQIYVGSVIVNGLFSYLIHLIIFISKRIFMSIYEQYINAVAPQQSETWPFIF